MIVGKGYVAILSTNQRGPVNGKSMYSAVKRRGIKLPDNDVLEDQQG
jgi:hypothetical protein